MFVTARKLHPLFGAELTGVPVAGAITPDLRDQLLDHVYKDGLVLIRDQNLSEDQVNAFARSLGPLWSANTNFGDQKTFGFNITTNAMYRYTNRGSDEKLREATLNTTLKVNERWHTDSSYTRPGATVSVFIGHILPPEGGNTEICDTRIAYEALDPAMQERLQNLNGYHSMVYSKARAFGEPINHDNVKPAAVKRPLVHRHVSERTALCIANHIGRIDGLSDIECEKLLADLMDIATTPERVYSHPWQAGDILLWDNRCTMHRAPVYDSKKYEREMWIVRLADEAEMAQA